MKNISFMRNGKEFEPTKDELKRVLDDYAERLTLTEKALELACQRIYELNFPSASTKDKESRHDILINDFKTKAKEMKSE